MRGESGIGGSASNFKPAFTGAKYRAAGGMAGYMVGEQGPELFMPDRPGRVVPAGEVGNAGSAPVNVSFSIQTIDSQDMEQALIRQRGNIIGMIREAANNHGEFFLESINTQSYETGGGGRQYDGTSGLKSK
jgi:phage-related minor tail protein